MTQGTRSRRSITIAAAATTAALVGVWVVTLGSPSSSATSTCDPYKGAIAESAKFTPYENQLSHLPEAPLNPSGSETPEVPQNLYVPSIADMPLQWAVVAPDGAVTQYYLDRPIDSKMTAADFAAAGGIQLDSAPSDNAGDFSDYMLREVGQRAIEVEVGTDFTGALVWADPTDEGGQRPHHVYWDADGYSHGLIINVGPEAAVTTARSIACRAG